MDNNLEPAEAPKSGWAKIRGEDITFKDHMKNACKPGNVAVAILGFLGTSLLSVGGTTSYVTGGIMLAAIICLIPIVIKQIKEKKRAQLAANPPKTA